MDILLSNQIRQIGCRQLLILVRPTSILGLTLRLALLCRWHRDLIVSQDEVHIDTSCLHSDRYVQTLISLGRVWFARIFCALVVLLSLHRNMKTAITSIIAIRVAVTFTWHIR